MWTTKHIDDANSIVLMQDEWARRIAVNIGDRAAVLSLAWEYRAKMRNPYHVIRGVERYCDPRPRLQSLSCIRRLALEISMGLKRTEAGR